MRIPMHQLDAFTDRMFGGNPAAVCVLESWLPDATMLDIARENNLSETAFLVPGNGDADYAIRWFTPGREIDLCGHATLASAAVVLRRLRTDLEEVRFASMSGPLTVRQAGGRLELDFPARPAQDASVTDAVSAALGVKPVAMLDSGILHAVFEDAETVRTLAPDIAAIAAIPPGMLSVTAISDDGLAYVCRFFAPSHGIPEDPVTGSLQCALGPYWAERLGRSPLEVRQLSARGGEMRVTVDGDRVRIAGQTVFVLEGTLSLPEEKTTLIAGPADS